MNVRTDKAAAVEFLQWWFGDDPAPHYIGISYQRDTDASTLDDAPQIEEIDDDLEEVAESNKAKGKRKVEAFAYSRPHKAVMSQWDNESDRNHIYFCTTPLLSQRSRLQAANAAGVPGLWVDIDAMRDLDIDGDEFFVELRDQEPASCWTRSSKQGIQSFFKLDKFFSLLSSEQPESDEESGDDDGKRRRAPQHKVFREELKPLLLNMAYYFGGDLNVISPARLMRLPGSVNPKRDNYECKAQYSDNAFTMAELRKRFKTDENLVPRVVFYAIAKAMEKVYGPGSHHDPSVKLFGTCRTIGINEDACEQLARELHRFFKAMQDDPTPSVASTYALDMEMDGIATLRSDYEEIADDVERAVKFWVNLKIKYCKALGLRWKPEVDNPLSDSPAYEGDGTFQIKPEGTFFTNKDDFPELFANFSIRILHKVIKVDGKEVDIAELIFNGRRHIFEWASEKDTNFTKFKTIPGLPPKLMVLKEDMWKTYVAWLGQQPVEKYLQEMPYYGLLDVEEGKPSLLMPGQPHPDYVWAESPHDTANHRYAFKHVSKSEATEYLQGFAQHYPHYHEKKFLWVSLGWFASCPFSAFARSIYKGFPVLSVSGLKESGKTHLIKYVLASHMGCEDAQTYLGTTLAARRSQLASNNLLPLVVDEFRDIDEVRTSQFLDLIRNLWDKAARRAKTMDGGASIDRLVGMLCVVGEHQYEDGATLDRTVSIHVTRDFIESTFTMTSEQRQRLKEAREWLESGQRKGVLGSLIFQWMQENMHDVPRLIDKAKRIIDENLQGRQLRNAIGLSLVVFGLLVMARVFKAYGLSFPLDKETMLSAIIEADEAINTNTVYGAANLKTLFSVTDDIILDSIRRDQPLKGTVYEFDPEDPDIVYFDLGRWYGHTHKLMKGSHSATLMNRTAFHDLLQVSTRNEESPIMEFPEDHPIFRKSCVKIDLNLVREQFNINTQQWRLNVDDVRDYDA